MGHGVAAITETVDLLQNHFPLLHMRKDQSSGGSADIYRKIVSRTHVLPLADSCSFCLFIKKTFIDADMERAVQLAEHIRLHGLPFTVCD